MAGRRVMLSTDLAALYGVEPRSLHQAVKRNGERFPADFMFRLSRQELANLRSQPVMSSWGGARRAPLALTQEGVAMLSSVLRSPQQTVYNIPVDFDAVGSIHLSGTASTSACRLSSQGPPASLSAGNQPPRGGLLTSGPASYDLRASGSRGTRRRFEMRP